MSFVRRSGKKPVPATGATPAPTAVGTLTAWVVDQNSGNKTYVTSGGFNGASLTYSLFVGATGLSINPGNGLITADTFTTAIQSGTALTVRASNVSGVADQALSFTVQVVARRRPVMRQYVAVQRAATW